ncbi:glycosyltransferase family 4 protein [Labedaea rhizosphaerae]|uniref:Glycosyltransferase involved in cell wall biosynthesis n=1 Tax=Labedaea rhizosphaerae TaxID=598644 RepID=A0A4R6S2B3_LABRH|nr:glycosyltransferase family 1 protein [Labedaea rhizosphaerae]TDP93700.1 glycosyltransferase involved in cell wall biosynthesis [Labedaea rhizosphaerae]
MPALVVLTEQLFAPVPGGTGRYTAELMAALRRSLPADWSLSGVSAYHRGTPGRVLPLPRKALTLAWERGLPLWPGGDIVHAPTPFAPPRPRRGRALVVTIHDTVPFTHPETLTPRGAQWHRAMIKRYTTTASAVVVPTKAVAAELAQYAPGPAPVHVIGHGVSSALQDAGESSLALPDKYVLAVGTREPRKGLDVLVEAMSKVPELRLVIAGPAGWGAVELGDRAIVLGRLSDRELAVVLRRAAVLAVPSLAEGFGLPLLEAMALGVPVVHSDAPALVEVAGGTGLTARRGDPEALAAALRRVLDEPAETAERVQRARQRAQTYSWDAAAAALWSLYRSLYRSPTR